MCSENRLAYILYVINLFIFIHYTVCVPCSTVQQQLKPFQVTVIVSSCGILLWKYELGSILEYRVRKLSYYEVTFKVTVPVEVVADVSCCPVAHAQKLV